jgi:hypothetical protein
MVADGVDGCGGARFGVIEWREFAGALVRGGDS